jgi:tRNA(Ile2) C34 agmatinyltransferase TiaS
MNTFIFTKFPACGICGSETSDYKNTAFRCENCGYTGRMENNSRRLPLKSRTQSRPAGRNNKINTEDSTRLRQFLSKTNTI